MLQELVLCASGPTPGNSSLGSISLNDLTTTTSLFSLKQTGAGRKGTALVENSNGQGGFILSLQADKALMNVYSFQKDQLISKMVLPEKLSCIAVDKRGRYCAGGTNSGRMYLWEVPSGILFNSWEAHYRNVKAIAFTIDGAAIVSGSEDSGVHVWEVARLVDNDMQGELPMPFCSFSDHTLGITDILVGIGPFANARVLTSSLDSTVKLWDLSTKTLLSTFIFPTPIACITWGLSERFFFAASLEGSIHRVNLYRKRVDIFRTTTLEAVGGSGSLGQAVRISEEDAETSRLISVGETITCLTLTMTAHQLLVGLASGLVNIYDTATHQLLRTINSHKGQPITFVAAILKPPDLMGHIGLGETSGSREPIPVRSVLPFQRIRDPKARLAHEVTMMLPAQNVLPQKTEEDIYQDILEEHAFFMNPTEEVTPSSNPSLENRARELEAEVASLRVQLGKAKGINDAMWETVKQKVLPLQNVEADGSVPMDDGESARKRPRT